MTKKVQRTVNWNIPDFVDPKDNNNDDGNGTKRPGSGNKRKSFHEFRTEGIALGSSLGFIDASGIDNVVLLTIARGSGKVMFKLTVNNDFTWLMHYKDVLLRKNLPLLKNVPEQLQFVDLQHLQF